MYFGGRSFIVRAPRPDGRGPSTEGYIDEHDHHSPRTAERAVSAMKHCWHPRSLLRRRR